jgi:hypothetical protein
MSRSTMRDLPRREPTAAAPPRGHPTARRPRRGPVAVHAPIGRNRSLLPRLALPACCLLASLLPGCADMTPTDFADAQPRLTFEDYFAGHTKAWGLFEDRFGRVKRQFTVDIDGSWNGGILTLDEHFLYDDGETEERIWSIRKLGPDRYEGTAADVVGVAQGRSAGNALNWKYTLDLKVGDGRLKLRFDDWMFLQPGGVMINRAHVSKWGVEVGSVTLCFERGVRL